MNDDEILEKWLAAKSDEEYLDFVLMNTLDEVLKEEKQ
jgi:hypothetical protein